MIEAFEASSVGSKSLWIFSARAGVARNTMRNAVVRVFCTTNSNNSPTSLLLLSRGVRNSGDPTFSGPHSRHWQLFQQRKINLKIPHSITIERDPSPSISPLRYYLLDYGPGHPGHVSQATAAHLACTTLKAILWQPHNPHLSTRISIHLPTAKAYT